MSPLNLDQLANFFSTLFGNCKGQIEGRCLPSEHRDFFLLSDTKGIKAFIQQHESENIYFAVSTRERGGKKEHIVSIPVLWNDIDSPSSTVLETVQSFRLQPSYIVYSGGGYHCYWLLKKPLGKESIPMVEDINHRLAEHLGGDHASCDASRILRVPGTLNHKYNPPREVKIVFQNDRRYDLSDFDFLPPWQKDKRTNAGNDGKGHNSWLYQAMQGIEEPGRNVTAIRLAGYFVNKLPIEDVSLILQMWNRKNHPPLPEDELERVIRSASKYAPEAEPWPDPIPFDEFSFLPDFPLAALPSIGREMVATVAKVKQVDPGLAACCYLGVLSVCLQKKAEVDLVSHQEPLNQYLAPIAHPGERKSSTQRDLAEPLYRYAREKAEELGSAIAKSQSDYKILEKRLAKLQDDAAKMKEETERRRLQDEASQLADEIRRNPPLKSPVYLVDDVTLEALGDLMADQGERMGIVSAEGGIFQILAGLYTERMPNIDLVLKAHPGDPWDNRRIGRTSKAMNRPALTMVLTVQPETIREIGKNRAFRGRGLLARFLYCYCKTQAGYRLRQTESIPKNLKDRYQQHIKDLMVVSLKDEPVLIRLSEEGQKLWDSFYNAVERSMQPGGDLETLKDWGSKLPGAVGRITGVLHLAKYGEKFFDLEIETNTVKAACAIGAYFKEHALAAFGLMAEDKRIESAKRILEFITYHKPESFKARDVLANKNAFKTIDDVTPGLKVLNERGFIRETKNPYQGKGRPEAVIYEVNPKIFSSKPLQNTSNNNKTQYKETFAGIVGENLGVEA